MEYRQSVDTSLQPRIPRPPLPIRQTPTHEPRHRHRAQCALQQPQIEFEDTAGKEVLFDSESHRELARFPRRVSPGGKPRATTGSEQELPLYSEEFPGGGGGGVVGGSSRGSGGDNDAQGRVCCIVFPATYASIARWPPSDAAKSGVIVFAG